MNLDTIIDRLNSEPEKLAEMMEVAKQMVGSRKWFPNEGPQSEAYDSNADVLLYGGQAGGGKTHLASWRIAANCGRSVASFFDHGDG